MSLSKHFAVLIAGAFLATSASAADERKSADAPPAASSPAQKADKPKARRHNHAAERGAGVSSDPGAPKPRKKPLHDHRREHKQQ